MPILTCHNAECPLWHPDEQRLYWTDIPTGRLFRYDWATGTSEQIYSGEVVGGLTLQADGALLLLKAGGVIARWQDGVETLLVTGLPGEEGSRFNDAIADPYGRVFAGTMPTPERLGRLYRLDPDGSVHVLLEGIGVSNGLGFHRDGRSLYYTDSPRCEIYQFDYDGVTGEIVNQRVVITTPRTAGVPDGLTVDAAGCIWSARWDGGHLFRYAPTGEELQRLPLPARKVSSVVFGGPDYQDIFITTAGGNQRATEGEGAGKVFCVNLGIQGVPEFRSRFAMQPHL
ncbi:MAG: SMP-30/gluconolactonase/LRE family protein [Spirulinaceae cyanobacterium RM2_2_10]|nr:SMP-30/gluconolactonase/LRE family protein [Spirulinaceae cyanobacterium RM2_2_10]